MLCLCYVTFYGDFHEHGNHSHLIIVESNIIQSLRDRAAEIYIAIVLRAKNK